MMDPVVVAELDAIAMDEAMGVLYTEGNGAFNHYLCDCLGEAFGDVVEFMREHVRRVEVGDSRNNTAWDLRQKWFTRSDVHACMSEAYEILNAELNCAHSIRCTPVAERDAMASFFAHNMSDAYGSHDADAIIRRVKEAL